MRPAVSVVVPSYDRVQFLKAAIGSLLAQTFDDWELIIADDGSDAETRAYLESLAAPPRIRVIFGAHCGKPGAVRNAALREARGEYIAFLDSDDLWLPEKLAAQITSLRAHPERQWSYTRFALVDAAGAPRPSARDWPAPSGWILEKLLREETVIALPSVVVARALLERLGAFDEELVMCEDDELWLRLAAASEIDGIDVPLTLVRRHGQHSGSDVIAWQDRKRVFERALREARDGAHRPLLRKLRVDMAVGLAKSLARSGRRTAALGTLAASTPYACGYLHFWRGAAETLVRAFAPAGVRKLVRHHQSAL